MFPKASYSHREGASLLAGRSAKQISNILVRVVLRSRNPREELVGKAGGSSLFISKAGRWQELRPARRSKNLLAKLVIDDSNNNQNNCTIWRTIPNRLDKVLGTDYGSSLSSVSRFAKKSGSSGLILALSRYSVRFPLPCISQYCVKISRKYFP